MYKSKRFSIKEFVSKQVFEKYGETAWQFLDPRLLETIDFIREKLGKPITINNWSWGGQLEQRGLRTNMDPIVKKKTDNGQLYCSAHMMGQAADFDVKGMTSHEVRSWIVQHSEDIPYPVRLEDSVSWIHLDVRDTGNQVYIFNP